MDPGYRDPFDQLLGDSPPLSFIREHLRKSLGLSGSVGRRRVSFLLLGETGTGKGLLAKAIHEAGPGAGGSFVSVNCAAIPESLVEAELFGFERGAFTDARKGKPGLFQQANKGTLFLDEVGLLPLAAQAKLLAVVEERRVRRLGSTRSEVVDACIVAATSVDLDAAVRRGLFREDLYYRLAVLPVRLPPLRERGRDIVVLARHFLSRACIDYGIPPRTLAPDACGLLVAHTWPGNVRELANLMERVVLVSDDQVVTASVLAVQSQVVARHSAGSTERADDRPGPHIPDVLAPERLSGFRSSVEQFERSQLVEALTRTQWNLTRTARLLGIPRNTLKYRMVKHGLRPKREANLTRRALPVGREAEASRSVPAEAIPVRSEIRTVAFVYAAVDAPAGQGGGTGRVLAECASKIDTFGGRVLEAGGSGTLAGFGIEPTEDSLDSAANAALAIARAVVRARGDTPLRARIGIHTGRCGVANHPGDPAQVDSEALRHGETATKALVESLISDGIVLSRPTAPLLERRFTIAAITLSPALKPVAVLVAEKHSPEQASSAHEGSYRLVGREPTGFGLGGRPLTPLVARQGELELVLSLVRRAARGQEQAVGVVGEPGVGKSRFLFELRARLQEIAGLPVSYWEGHCAPHGARVPYFPLIDLLRRHCGAKEEDVGRAVGERLHAALEASGMDAAATWPYLARLLGIPEGDSLAPLSPEAIRTRTFEALREFCIRSSRLRPLVLVLEDLHWIDATSEAFLSALVGRLGGAPILLIASYRTGYRLPWLEGANTTTIALPYLSPEESRSLVDAVPRADRLPADVLDSIVQRAAGNPFFLEELAWAAKESAPAAGAESLPATVQAALEARIARLPDGARRCVRVASVLGRTFPRRLLEKVAGPEGGLAADLHELQRRELLFEIPGPLPAYAFKHALTQEVAYSTVDEDERSALHLAAGRALETLHAERPEEAYADLAHHYGQSKDSSKAVHYLACLAEVATRSYALGEALNALRIALTHADRLGDEGRDSATLDLVIRHGVPLLLLGRFNDIVNLFEAHRPCVDRVGQGSLRARYYVLLGLAHDHLGHRIEAGTSARRGLVEAERCGDLITKGKAHFVLAFDGFWTGRFVDGIRHGRLAVELLGEQSWWQGHAAWVLSFNAVAVGDFKLALEASALADEIGQRTSEHRLRSYAASVAGWVAAVKGQAEVAVHSCERALALAPDPLSQTVAHQWLGYACLTAGDVTRAVNHLEAAVGRFRLFELTAVEAWASAWYSDALLAAGRIDAAHGAATTALTLAQRAEFPFGVGLAQRALGHALAASGDHGTARAQLLSAEGTWAAVGARYELSQTLLDLVKGDEALGATEAAANHREQAQQLLGAVQGLATG